MYVIRTVSHVVSVNDIFVRLIGHMNIFTMSSYRY